jgi:phosphopantetheinyl transferase
MNLPFQDCIVSVENLSVPLCRELLRYQHGMAYILLDLQKFQEELLKFSEQSVVAHYLSNPEQVYLNTLTSEKRKREWLGGRFAAKYVGADMLAQMQNPVPWSELAVIADKNGRPFLAADTKTGALPDISISHSGGLAAAMAVSKGFCGIDIQKITDRVVKVRERFCTPNEARLVRSFFNASQEIQSSALTRLWAAKESLRKTANTRSLPGFLELELMDIRQGPSQKSHASWKYIFAWKHTGVRGKPVTEKCCAAVCCFGDYALALTTRDDTFN